MSSILTNNSAMVALSTLRSINNSLGETQGRISSGLKVTSGKDNAAYFAISESMKGDSGMLKAVDEGLTLTKNSVATARLGAETVMDLANQFSERVAFAQGDAVDRVEIQKELAGLVERMTTTIAQSTFNGDDLVNADGLGAGAVSVVTGITRTGGTFATTTMAFNSVDLTGIKDALAAINVSTSLDLAADLTTAEAQLKAATSAATSLGVTEKSIETQQAFLGALTENLDSGVGAMIDADMEAEAARLQALQVQQQLATQSLSVANQAPQSILSLFR